MVKVTNTDVNAKDELIGQQVGASYVIKDRLGAGGMGLVYLAESTKIGGSTRIGGKIYGKKLAAVKVLTTRSSEAVARFRAEAYAAGMVDKFSVVDILDAGELATGQSYILMEYCDGGSLHDLLEQRGFAPFPFDEILSILSPVCAALVKAHEANLVHRDIKPANILFVKNGKVLRAKLSDFGLVKLREHAAFLMTARNSVMGTPGYMSPEQCVDTADVDSRSDIYSIGCLLYKLLTGRLPYAGTVNDVIQQTRSNAPIAPPSAFRRDLPPGWERTTMRCLAFRREDRFGTAMEVIHSLADGLENGRSLMGFHAPSLIEDVALGPTANTISSAAGGPAATEWSKAQSAIHQRERSLRRRSLVMLVAGSVGGVIVAGAIALMLRSTAEAPELDGRRVAQNNPGAEPFAPAPAGPDRAAPASLTGPASPAVAMPPHVNAAAARVAAPAVVASAPSQPTTASPPAAAEIPNSTAANLPRAAPSPPGHTTSLPAPEIANSIAAPPPAAPSPRGPTTSPPAPTEIAKGTAESPPRAAPSPRDASSPASLSAAAQLAAGLKEARNSAPGAAPPPRGAVPLAAAPARDALPTDKPKPTAEKDKRVRQAVAQGTLHVEVQTWADVVIGDWQDTTPVTRPLPAGRHRVLLRKGKQTELVDIVITPNQTTTITRSW